MYCVCIVTRLNKYLDLSWLMRRKQNKESSLTLVDKSYRLLHSERCNWTVAVQLQLQPCSLSLPRGIEWIHTRIPKANSARLYISVLADNLDVGAVARTVARRAVGRGVHQMTSSCYSKCIITSSSSNNNSNSRAHQYRHRRHQAATGMPPLSWSLSSWYSSCAKHPNLFTSWLAKNINLIYVFLVSAFMLNLRCTAASAYSALCH